MRKLAGLLIVLLLVAIPIANAQGDPASGAIDWLKTQKTEDGMYGTEPGETALALVTLGLLDEPDTEALAVLETYASDNADTLTINDMSLLTLAVSASGADITTFNDGTMFTNLTTQLGK